VTEAKYDDDGQFTNEYKFKIAIHPVLQDLFSIVLQHRKDLDDLTPRQRYENFFEGLEAASQNFHSLGPQAFEEAEIVQDGLRLVNDALYQFNPDLAENLSCEQNYTRVNKLFWGKYFFLNGMDGSKRVEETQSVSPWAAAKHFASEFWTFGQCEFPETIGLGYTWLLENDPNTKIDFSRISKLLARFGYDRETQVGFSYFLGLTVMTGRSGEDREDLQRRLLRLPAVDINDEYEELLGSLRDLILHHIFDELVWRFQGDFDVRSVSIAGSDKKISEYNFCNNAIIFPDDRRVENLKDAEQIFCKAMREFGRELLDNEYDDKMAFKTGVCAANIRAQFDAKTTAAAATHIINRLPLIFSAANRFSIQEGLSWAGHENIQIPLQEFLSGFPHELSSLIWTFQSFVLFEDGVAKTWVDEVNTMEFMTECRSMVLKFFEVSPEHCRSIAAKKLHWSIFPHLSREHDEKLAILAAIKDGFGYDEQVSTFADKASFKALIIFAYFCSLCETILFESQPQQLN
jgi:hypothetical protein